LFTKSHILWLRANLQPTLSVRPFITASRLGDTDKPETFAAAIMASTITWSEPTLPSELPDCALWTYVSLVDLNYGPSHPGEPLAPVSLVQTCTSFSTLTHDSSVQTFTVSGAASRAVHSKLVRKRSLSVSKHGKVYLLDPTSSNIQTISLQGTQ
jgi:hypothetical protein